MFIDYARRLLDAEDGLTESQKIRLAVSIERWAKRHDIQDLGKLHETLDLWIDDKLDGKSRRVVSLNMRPGEDSELIDFVKDPKSQNPAEIVVADREFRYLTVPETRDFVSGNLEGEELELFLDILGQNPEGHYSVDADMQTVRERIAILKPRINEGRLLVPKTVADIRFVNGELRISYVRGFDDEMVNQALHWYSKGLNPRQIAERIGIKATTLHDWLYRRMDLPRVGNKAVELERQHERQEVLRLYDEGLRPKQIAGRVGYGHQTICEILKDEREVDFVWGGPDPWVYELVGNTKTLWDLMKLDLKYKRRREKGSRIYDTTERYKSVFKFIRDFERRVGTGPSRDEVHYGVGFQPWLYLQDFVRLGVLGRRKLPKEEYNV